MTTTALPSRRVRSRLLVLVAIGTLIGAACSPAAGTGSGSGGTYIPFGPVTIPLPPLGVTPPATNIPLLGGLCNIAYHPPSFNIVGATVTIPGVEINPTDEIISVPNIVVNIPQTILGLPALSLQCGLVTLSTAVNVIIPAQSNVQAAVINLKTMTLTLNNPSFTINGVGLSLPGLGGAGLLIPLPPITVPFGSVSIPLN